MKNNPHFTGLLAVLSPIPFLFFTIFWYWIWFFGIGLRFYEPAAVPQWLHIIGVLPLFISPILGVIGFIHGIRKRKQKHAWISILLSVIGLLENFLLFWGIFYLGSTF